MRRRTFVATTAGLGAALVAGCSDGSGSGGGSSDDDGGGGTDADSPAIGSFQLLVSDQPAAIEDFDSLNVSFEKARVFHGDKDETDSDDGDKTATNETTTNETTDSGGTEQPETETPSESEEEDDQEREDEGSEEEFREITLEGTTVDLTEVVGDKATGIFDGELPAGTYTKIELHATDVEGMVDGEEVAVKIPSEKLQIVKSFEVVADENTSFVFDINVVKKGPNGYNLLPVISESGVTGKDVEVEEVDSEDDNERGTPPDDNTTSNGDSGNN